MHIKKGDNVIVITGADKGKTGIVQRAYPKLQKVVVEGVNIKKKHRKPTQNNPEGSILELYAPIHVSNVALIDPKTKKPTRVGVRIEKGQKVRYAKKSGETIK